MHARTRAMFEHTSITSKKDTIIPEKVIPVTPSLANNNQDIHAWKNMTTNGDDRIAKSLVFEGLVSVDGDRNSKKPASILYDTGSGTQIISPSFVTQCN